MLESGDGVTTRLDPAGHLTDSLLVCGHSPTRRLVDNGDGNVLIFPLATRVDLATPAISQHVVVRPPIDAVETKRTLLTDSVTELTLELRETNDVLVALARDGDCDIAFDGVVPQQDDAARLCFTATDCDVDSMRSAGARLSGVADLALVQEDKTRCRFEMTVTEPTIASRIIDNGGLIRSFTVTERAATVVVDLPNTTSVRKFVETIQDAYPKAALASRRTRDRPITTRGDLREALNERFTTRQREILETAYRSGFFESPRVRTGEELSELLKISQSTFSYHLREAERTLCELVFADRQSSR